MAQGSQLRGDGPQAAALTRFRRLASQTASFGDYRLRDGLAAFTATGIGPLGLASVPQLGDQPSLLELAYSPQDLSHQLSRRGRVGEVAGRVHRHRARSRAWPVNWTARSRAKRLAFSTKNHRHLVGFTVGQERGEAGTADDRVAPDTAASQNASRSW